MSEILLVGEFSNELKSIRVNPMQWDLGKVGVGSMLASGLFGDRKPSNCGRQESSIR